ncbi:hypothetical protein KKC45_02455 [Patescibacteria group bacterium]|nr:hypothetical protein [Patescibacteria group bacterium]
MKLTIILLSVIGIPFFIFILVLFFLSKKPELINLEPSKNEPLKYIKNFFGFIWEITPLSLILTAITAIYVAGIWFCDITGLVTFVNEKVLLLPFVNEKITFVVEYSIRGILTLTWFILAIIDVKQRHLMVLRVFRKRIPFPFLYLSEGWKGTIIPWPIVDGIQKTIVEFTLGAIPGQEGKYRSISCQTLDDQEVILEYAVQGRTRDPFLWENTEKPEESIENKLLSQLRIIVALFKEKEVNTLKGAVAGMLLGKEYLVWRNSEGDLLRNSGGIVLAVPSNKKKIEEILSTPSDKITKRCLRQYLDNLEEINSGEADGSRENYSIETIPSVTFDLDAVWKEAKRVGGEIEPPSLRDITPPKKVREAAEEKRIEELQGDARREENMRHSQIALEVLGLPTDTKVLDLDDKTYEKWRALKDDSLIQERKINKVTVNSTGHKGGDDLSKNIVAAATLNRGDQNGS